MIKKNLGEVNRLKNDKFDSLVIKCLLLFFLVPYGKRKIIYTEGLFIIPYFNAVQPLVGKDKVMAPVPFPP